MNAFKSLDTIYPVGDANRPTGEVVNVAIRVFLDNVDLGEVEMKRKAWYVNTSVNAFHMHRSLVRDFTEQIRNLDLATGVVRRAKRLISLAVLDAYLLGRETEEQYFEYYLYIDTARPYSQAAKMKMMRLGDTGAKYSSKEVRDISTYSLTELVSGSVEDFQLVGKVW